jgi:hypothetical protein
LKWLERAVLRRFFCLAAILWGYASSADALCIYSGKHFEKSASAEFGGRLYAKTTLEDEFADSALVIRGAAVSSREIRARDFDENPGVVYRIKVDQAFKGKPAPTLADFSERNSSGFYLTRGTQYLLFLDPIDPTEKRAPGTMVVNYSCGQSRPWADVSLRDREHLANLSASGKSN